jgi:hypothetical protein
MDWLHWTLIGVIVISEGLPFIYKVRANGIADLVRRVLS